MVCGVPDTNGLNPCGNYSYLLDDHCIDDHGKRNFRRHSSRINQLIKTLFYVNLKCSIYFCVWENAFPDPSLVNKEYYVL